jgi:hypothetical protein
MNDYDKYINDYLMSKIYKNRLEKTNNNDNDFDNIFCNEYKSKVVTYTCASNETRIDKEELEKFLTHLKNQLEFKRKISYLEYFYEPAFRMNIFT